MNPIQFIHQRFWKSGIEPFLRDTHAALQIKELP